MSTYNVLPANFFTYWV